MAISPLDGLPRQLKHLMGHSFDTVATARRKYIKATTFGGGEAQATDASHEVTMTLVGK
jgi:hypothetical protein